MMTTRELPRAEWHRISEADGGLHVIPETVPENTKIVVVEDADGKIVGSWMLLRTVHVECLWIAPSHRKRGSVFRRLLSQMTASARAWGAKVVLTHSAADDVARLVKNYGGVPIDAQAWVFKLKESLTCPRS